jgi:catechol 2,3-dioxygenase-like lactoylglutathione lyase family enzyme
MLKDATVCATIAVNDIEEAKKFYGNTLGLNEVDESAGGIMYVSGNGRLFVYQSTTAGTGEATCAAWGVSDVEDVVEDLKSRGVKFERYEIPGAVMQGDVSVMGSQKSAWFKEPDGNILAVNGEKAKKLGLLDQETQV